MAAPFGWRKKYNANVTGISIAQSQITKATKLAHKYQVGDKTKFLNQDYCKTNFADKSFDVVWGIESVCHTKNKEDFIKEAARLLESGGRLVVSDGFLAKNQYSAEENKQMSIWLDGWALPNLAHYNDFAKLLRKHGFEDVSYEDASPNVMKFSEWLHNRTKLFYPIGLLLQTVGIRGEIEQNNMQSAIWQYPCLKDGLWQYGIFTARKK